MEYKLDTKIAERKNKEVFKEDGKTIKLFVKGYSKADILNEALTQARVEEGTNLKIPKLLEVTKINDRWALISEYIEGDTLEELGDCVIQDEDNLKEFKKMMWENANDFDDAEAQQVMYATALEADKAYQRQKYFKKLNSIKNKKMLYKFACTAFFVKNSVLCVIFC